MYFLVYGDDNYRSRRKLAALREHFAKTRDAAGLNMVVLRQNEHGMDAVAEALFASPFLAERKLVVLEGFLGSSEADKDNLMDMLQRKPETAIAIFYEDRGAAGIKDGELYVLLKKQKFTEEFRTFDGGEAERFAKKESASSGMKIDNKAVRSLVSLVGTDSWTIHQEVRKLCAYAAAKGEKTITEPMVHELVNGEQDESVFAFLDACTAGKAGSASAILEGLLNSGTTVLQVTSMLQRQMKMLIGARDLIDRGIRDKQALAKKLGVHPYPAGKALVAARSYTLEALCERHGDLLEIERYSKTGSAKAEAALNAFAVRLAESRS